jgi:hypothetical protein
MKEFDAEMQSPKRRVSAIMNSVVEVGMVGVFCALREDAMINDPN